MNAITNFYVSGGTLPSDAPSYVERRADKELYQKLLNGDFCYVLTSRQMGKSSLMGRTANRLRQEKCQVVVLDLTAIGQNLTPEQWYGGLLTRLGRQLRLEDELDDFWLENTRLSPVQRLFTGIRDIVMLKRTERLVIFVDEIDTIRSLPFTMDEFFAAIRECYNRRNQDSEFCRLTFCLLGVATPADLISDTLTTPFNIGHRIELTDFTSEEASALAKGLADKEEDARILLERVLYWTNGHPYLTQRLCSTISKIVHQSSALEARGHSLAATRELVDDLCEELFLSNRARERDDNLLFVRECLLRSAGDLASLLNLYYQIRNGRRVRDEETNSLIDHLRLSGITRVNNGCLSVRNRIYYLVFDNDWIAATVPTKSSERKSIAVLPFRNLSSDPDNEYLSDGITEDLITALSQIKALWVAARTSSFTFKGQQKDIRKIGNLLRVSLLLEGSVRKVQNNLRITAQLVHTKDGYQLWSEKFDRRMEDVFSIQDEISRKIVDALKLKLAQETTAPIVKRQTANTEAYQYYLRGRYFYNRRGVGLRKGLLFFQLALLEDANYALAFTGLADSYNLLAFYDYLPPKDAVPKAKEAALKALELDETLAEAHSSLGFAYLIYDWNWAAAEREFNRALELNPNCGSALYWYACYLTAIGQHDGAIAVDRKAVELDPLSHLAKCQFAWLHLVARKYDEAKSQLYAALENQPNFMVAHWILGQLHAAQGQFENAISELRRAVELSEESSWMLAMLGFVYGVSGDKSKAEGILRELEQRASASYVRTTLLVTVHIGLSNTERALDLLERALEERDIGLVWLKVDFIYDSLRSNPRFANLLTKLKLNPA